MTKKLNGHCEKCGKPMSYIGDVPQGGFPKGSEPWCTCGGDAEEYRLFAPFQNWRYCPHCGRELK